MRVRYNTPETGLSNAAQYNGNISAVVFAGTMPAKKGYFFTYDGLNRLTVSDYKSYTGTAWADSTANEEKNISYDKNGNLTGLTRTKRNGANGNVFGSFTYQGNKLVSFTDAVNATTYQYKKTTTGVCC
jgi:hypothetical protein